MKKAKKAVKKARKKAVRKRRPVSDLTKRIRKARKGAPADITAAIHDGSMEVVSAVLHNPFLQEDHLLTLLNRRDLPGQFLEDFSKNTKLMESQRIKLAMALNPKTPRLVTLGLLKFLYLFDLVQVSLRPGVPAEIKRQTENRLIAQLDQIPVGRRVQLARRGSGRIAAALIIIGNPQTIEPALDNPFLTEGDLYKIFQRDKISQKVLVAVAKHRKWSLRYNVRLQLVRHPLTPLGTAMRFIPGLRVQDLRLLVGDKRMPTPMQRYLKSELERRTGGRPRGKGRILV